MKARAWLLAFLVLVAAACGSAPEPTATATAVNSRGEARPAPTFTPTPLPSDAYVPTATNTPAADLPYRNSYELRPAQIPPQHPSPTATITPTAVPTAIPMPAAMNTPAPSGDGGGETGRVAAAFLAALGDVDVEAMGAVLADDVVFTLGFIRLPGKGLCAQATAAAARSEVEVEVSEPAVEGERAVARITMDGGMRWAAWRVKQGWS